MSFADWLAFLAWEFLASVLIGMWLGRLRARRLDRAAERLLMAPHVSTALPTVAELHGPAWMTEEDE